MTVTIENISLAREAGQRELHRMRDEIVTLQQETVRYSQLGDGELYEAFLKQIEKRFLLERTAQQMFNTIFDVIDGKEQP